uniref:Uncharacterized protein n=1 Tax=Podoviridae sp. ctYFd1 TaxID=2826560 RepID=A0A8S5R1F2_9CAUD|nr:MAG TPA: hypothetical protein [Podoviridae sp. ctYFd1]
MLRRRLQPARPDSSPFSFAAGRWPLHHQQREQKKPPARFQHLYTSLNLHRIKQPGTLQTEAGIKLSNTFGMDASSDPHVDHCGAVFFRPFDKCAGQPWASTAATMLRSDEQSIFKRHQLAGKKLFRDTAAEPANHLTIFFSHQHAAGSGINQALSQFRAFIRIKG